ncbi:hypothetical protein GCM10010411_74670 [Actinomadura fulvescens]|uniref:Uncharacterized protein n=1 Tax=Actinomadura fulvescens TaxID=46160 RepID=A0ABP6CXA5_9ACTN
MTFVLVLALATVLVHAAGVWVAIGAAIAGSQEDLHLVHGLFAVGSWLAFVSAMAMRDVELSSIACAVAVVFTLFRRYR